ncbi:MAG: acyl carrier protein [Oligoflexales bacterium]|nr:acyl carrier protein [Oligoflexales bacterium]
MSRDQIYQDVVSIISKHAQNRSALVSVTGSTHILNDLQVNSARLVDIILDFEDKFNVAISDDDADRIETVGDAVSMVEKLM